MNDFDITEFSNLDAVKKERLRDVIAEAKLAKDMPSLRKLASITFIVASDSTPNIDKLLSSKKDFREPWAYCYSATRRWLHPRPDGERPSPSGF